MQEKGQTHITSLTTIKIHGTIQKKNKQIEGFQIRNK